jgi:hypothetical protein
MNRTPGLTFRFGVRDPAGLQSGVWRVWTDPGKSDVYVAIRTIAGISKISLHATGTCNASLTSQAVKNDSTIAERLGGSRHLDQWNRPMHTGALLSIPLRIRFLTSELRMRIGSEVPEKKVVWLPAPPSDHAVDVVCNFTSQVFKSGKWPWRDEGGALLASAELQNGEAFWLTALVYRAPPGLCSMIEQQRARARIPPNSRLLIGETGPGNVRVLTDAASSTDHGFLCVN